MVLTMKMMIMVMRIRIRIMGMQIGMRRIWMGMGTRRRTSIYKPLNILMYYFKEFLTLDLIKLEANCEAL